MIKLRPSIEICRKTLGDNVKGAEIGVLGGGNARSMLNNYPQLSKIHLVDSYGGITEDDKQLQEFKAKFEPYGERITWHIKTSMDAVKDFENGSLDYVYIDANHRYFEVMQDIKAWWEIVRPGGILCGHDYFSYGSVKKAVDDWAKETNNYIFSTLPDWWVFKD